MYQGGRKGGKFKKIGAYFFLPLFSQQSSGYMGGPGSATLGRLFPKTYQAVAVPIAAWVFPKAPPGSAEEASVTLSITGEGARAAVHS